MAQSLRILLVEDVEDDALLLVPALERAQRDVALQRERRHTSAELIRHREQLKGANQKLLAAHARINTILAQMRDGFASFDRDWRCTQLNTAVAEMWRPPPEQLLDKNHLGDLAAGL